MPFHDFPGDRQPDAMAPAQLVAGVDPVANAEHRLEVIVTDSDTVVADMKFHGVLRWPLPSPDDPGGREVGFESKPISTHFSGLSL